MCQKSYDHYSATKNINENILACLEQKCFKQYSARINRIATANLDFFLNSTVKWSQVQFEFKFASNSRTIHEEMVINDEIWLIGSLGGSLGLFIGFSLFGYVATLLDIFVDMASRSLKIPNF